MTPEDERGLVRRLVERRDPAAFAALYARHTPVLYAVALRLSGNAADAEDHVHDAWVRAVEGLGRFRFEASLRTWLVAIVLNRIREAARERVALTLDAIAEPAGPDLPPLPHGVDALDLERAIAALPGGYRTVLVLHDVEGFTHQDIAAMLGIDPGTSKSQLARARRRLRQVLTLDDGGQADG